jgi:hypothetical protein
MTARSPGVDEEPNDDIDADVDIDAEEAREWSEVDGSEDSAAPLDAMTQALLEITHNKRSILLVGAPHTPAEERLLSALMGRERDRAITPTLVTVTEPPAQRVVHCEDYPAALVSEITVLAVETPAWRASNIADAPSEIEVDGTTVPITVEKVGDIGELRRLGIRLNQILIEAAEVDRFVPITIPLADILEVDASSTRAFRFLSVLRRRIAEYGGLLVVTVDPEHYEGEPPQRYEELFDVSFAFDKNGHLEQL